MSQISKKSNQSEVTTHNTTTTTTNEPSGATAHESGASAAEREVEVLYQRIGDRWFAFSVIDDEVYMGSIPQGTVGHGDLIK